MNKNEVFSFIMDEIKNAQLKKCKPFRIAVNGIEGTGKTTLAYELVTYLKVNNFEAHHVSIDGFHFNKKVRYQRGRDSAKGYYEDSYNESAFVEKVLQLSQANVPKYIPATHDLETDEYLDLLPIILTDNSVIVTDGCYLFKPIFNAYWDLRIYLRTDFDTALERAIKRDQDSLGGYDKTKEKYELRYHAASKQYISEINPEVLADILIDNTDFENLKLRTRQC